MQAHANSNMGSFIQYLHSIFLEDIACIDIRSVSTVSDFFLIATVKSRGQLKGAIRKLHEYFYEEQIECKGGKKFDVDSDWILLDCDEFILHIMKEESRKYYDLEGLWQSLGAVVVKEGELLEYF